MIRNFIVAAAIVGACFSPNAAWAQAEVCGDGTDNNSNGRTDEGCYSQLNTGQCESPLSCAETGMVSPLKGSLRYQLPPDVSPKVPFGPGIGFRRFYTSQYAPGGGAPVWKKPMGERWHHTYMVWLAKTGTAPSSTIVLHHQGQDVRAAYASASGGWEMYTPQAGFRVKLLRQRQAAPNEFQLVTLTGETFVYNSSGRLTEIWDAQAGAATKKVLLTYDGNGQVSTVTDATNTRRLLFGYTSNQLTSLQFQTNAGSWTTQHTTSYAYASGALSTVTIGGSLAQTNTYSSGYLTHIQDAASKSIVQFAYTATAGQVARVDTTQGMIGFEYASGRAACSGKTVLHFNRGNTTSCSVDGDCGAGFLCGGKTGAGATGVCFRAAKCLTVSSPSDDVITGVAALGPPSESCTGACATVTQYLWNGTGSLDNYATQDGAGNYTTRTFDGNGMVTQITYGDPDSTVGNGNGSRTEWRFYTDTNFPGKVTEIRRRSDLSPSASSCSGTNPAGCMITTFEYVPPTGIPGGPNAGGGGKLWKRTESAFVTLNPDGTPSTTPVSHVTSYGYDADGRVTQIDGPLAGTNDLTLFEYHSSGGVLVEKFLSKIRRKVVFTPVGGAPQTSYLDQQATVYDFWGNPTTLVDADGTLTCLTFSAARGTLTLRREAMAGQSTCTVGAGDLVTQWERDSALRLTKLTRPDNSCLIYEYDSKGRLQRTKRRDDCNAGSSGDKQEFVYDAEGLVTEIQTYDASNVLTAKQPFSYFDSRRLEKAINPVNASTWTGVVYDARGLVQQVDAAGGLGKTIFERTGTPGAEGRVTDVKKYKTSSTFDTWSLIFSWFGEQTQVTDGDSKTTHTVHDDLGRVVKLISPDMTYPVINRYDEASRKHQVQERFGAGSDQRNHTFTFDTLGRPLEDDYAVGHAAGTCSGTSNPPEVTRAYDALPTGVSCPIGGGCNNTAGRLAYVKIRLMCVSTLPSDKSLDQETFYSYDRAGRVVVEYIRDDSGRTAQQTFSWTLNGDLLQAVTPSSASIDWGYGSVGSNSDTDLVTAVARNGAGNPVVNAITWFPYGPLKQYNQQNTDGGVALRTRFTKNLAYRPDKQFVERQSGGTIVHQLTVSEDAKGRVTGRDFTSTVSGVRDSFYLYDDQDRVLCETTTLVGSCPTSGSGLKNNHVASPPFTNAGDWKRLLRPIPGSTGLLHEINPSGYGTSHRIVNVNQGDGSPTLGYSQFNYFSDGDRSSDYLLSQTIDTYRSFAYDNRHNLREVLGYLSDGWSGVSLYTHTSGFDDAGRRVFKQFTWMGNTSTWFFYYDALNRLTEVRYTPSTSTPTNYTLFQLFWLDDRLTAYWQTDYPSVTTSKRYVVTDETNRPVEMWSWPASGNGAAVWAIDPSAWGFETLMLGPNVFQPVLFAGQYKDELTTAYLYADGSTIHRPGLVLNGFRTYDPFTGSYLQVDPLVPETWSSYRYVDSNPVGSKDPLGLMKKDEKRTERTYILDGGDTWWWGAWGSCYDSNWTATVSECLAGGDVWDNGGGWGGGGGGDAEEYGLRIAIEIDCRYDRAVNYCHPKSQAHSRCMHWRCQKSYCSDPRWSGRACTTSELYTAWEATQKYRALDGPLSCDDILEATTCGRYGWKPKLPRATTDQPHFPQ